MRTIRSLYRRLDVALAMHAPFVWRTRAALWIGLGLFLALTLMVIARTMDVRRETVPTLASVSSWLSMAQFCLFAAFFMIVVDVRRRTRAVAVFQHRLRVVTCVMTVCVVLLVLPTYTFVSVIAPRIAALESGEHLQALVDFHGAHSFWKCWPDEQNLRRTTMGHEQAIVADLARYGFTTRFETGAFGHVCPQSGPLGFSIVINRLGEGETSWDFEGRLRNVEAAQHYMRGDLPGEYGALSLFWMVPFASIGAVLSLIGSRRRSAWSVVRRTLAFSGPWTYALRWRPRLDIFLAWRFPTLFSARLHASPWSVVILSAVLVLAATGVNPGVTAFAALAVLSSIYFVLRAQEATRHQLAPGPEDIKTLILHAAWLFVLISVELRLLSAWPELNLDGALVMVWLGLIVCAMMQAARATSALIAFGGMIGSFVVMYFALLALQGLDLVSGDKPLFIAFSLLAAPPLVALRIMNRLDVYPAIRKLTLTLLLAMTPSVGFAGVFLTLAPTPGSMSPSKLVAAAIGGLLAIALVLRVTEDARRVLATTR